ncbi:mechanosensitive ion channel family protein [Synechocystis sp. LKSZ1]|uniref:mechanosensitive ion channel family protein n=1 Tax=Synechocystis sp. LKSZ1 TaxID=3144951 RepID=UPI00336BF2AB
MATVCILLTANLQGLVLAQVSPSPVASPPTLSAIVLDGQPLITIQGPLGSLDAVKRAERGSRYLQEFADDQSLSLDSLEIYTGDNDGIPLSSISAGSINILTISNRDAEKAGQSRRALATAYAQKLRQAVERYRQERNVRYLLQAAVWSLLATVLLILFLLIINHFFAGLYRRFQVWEQSYIHPVRLGNWELIRANQLDDIFRGLAWLLRAILILSLLLGYFSFVLHQFPWTRRIIQLFEGYFLESLQASGKAFTNYLPSLLTILFVCLVTYFFLRLAKPFFHELGVGTFSLPGFYPEWAQPTYRIVIFLGIALAAVIVFPLLPGFQSPAFQGISVFLGLLISLGSTSVIANLISGSVLIYTRAFRVGDRIRIGDITGIVLETTLLVTRIQTPTNIIVSIPNAQISTSSIENFSFGYREFQKPLILRVPVYLGYEVAWRDVYQALIQAALKTNGISASPSPFVLQGELNEVYVTYFLNAYIDVNYFKDKELKEVELSRSQLNENIRDCCAEAGIRIFAPSYEADPTNYGPAVDR